MWKKKNFVVFSDLDVIDKVTTVSTVSSSSKEEAKEIVKKELESRNDFVGDSIVMRVEEKNTREQIIATVLFVISVILSLTKWTIGTKHGQYDISPNLESGVYAVLVFLTLYVRFKGLNSIFDSLLDLIDCILIIALLSSFIRIVMIKQIDLFDFTTLFFQIKPFTFSTTHLIVLGIVLSFLGLKLLSLISYGVVLFVGISNLMKISSAMEIKGFIFFIFAIIGILLYLKNDPELQAALPFIQNTYRHGKHLLNNDLKISRQQVAGIKNHINMKHKKDS